MPQGLWDLSFPPRDQTWSPPAVKAPSPNYWSPREFPKVLNLGYVSDNVGLAKKSIWIFSEVVMGNLNELFGQPNIYSNKLHVISI